MADEDLPHQRAKFNLIDSTSDSEHVFQLDLPKFSKDYNFIQFLKDIEKDWSTSFSFSNGNLTDVENLFTFSLAYSDYRKPKDDGFTVTLNYEIKRVRWKNNDKYDSIIIQDEVLIAFKYGLGGNTYPLSFNPELNNSTEDYHFGSTEPTKFYWDSDDQAIIVTIIVTKRSFGSWEKAQYKLKFLNYKGPEGSIENVSRDLIKPFPNVLKAKTLKGSFSKYFLNEKFSDFKVVAGEKVFPAHRFVLSELSRFCDRMFATDMIENQNGTWNIEDFDTAVVHEFLEFAYTGTSKNLKLESINSVKILKELFRMGHKYYVVPLKAQCEYLLKSKINDKNVVSLYYMGFLCESESLMAVAKVHFKRIKLQIIPNPRALSELYKTYPEDMIYELAIK